MKALVLAGGLLAANVAVADLAPPQKNTVDYSGAAAAELYNSLNTNSPNVKESSRRGVAGVTYTRIFSSSDGALSIRCSFTAVNGTGGPAVCSVTQSDR